MSRHIDPFAFNSFVGSAEEIKRKEVLVSEFRKSIGASADPYGPLTGARETIAFQEEAIKRFKARL